MEIFGSNNPNCRVGENLGNHIYVRVRDFLTHFHESISGHNFLANHYVIANFQEFGEVRRLDGEERLSELAAMLGGDASGPAARAAAVELLERSTLGPGSETQ